MEILRITTLVYAAVLVLALAASLVTVVVYLRRIDAGLREVARSLVRVRASTEPLEALISPLRDVSVEMADELEAGEAGLRDADAALGVLAGRLGVGEPAR